MFSRFLPALLRGLPPENAHRIAIHGARWASHLSAPPVANICLRSQVLGMDLPHPIGLAAGFDKDAEAVSGLLALGFSFVEVGSITPLPQPGNPRPRVFRLPSDGAVINRYGFNSRGAQFVSDRLAHVRQQHPDAAVGINIGPNKTTTAIEQDLVTCIEHLGAYASPSEAADAWVRLERRLGQYLTGYERVIQVSNQSGGTWYRLRASGFADRNEALRLCAVLQAEYAECIAVVTD